MVGGEVAADDQPRLALPDCTTLRFFVWWTDGSSRTDIDLSVVFFGPDWERLGQVAYFNLKEWGRPQRRHHQRP